MLRRSGSHSDRSPVYRVTAITTTEITCDSCDAACCRLQVILVDDNRVPETMTEQSSWGGEVMLRRDDGWCTALDRTTMLCTIYDDRPQICRDFEMGSVECINERDASFSLL